MTAPLQSLLAHLEPQLAYLDARDRRDVAISLRRMLECGPVHAVQTLLKHGFFYCDLDILHGFIDWETWKFEDENVRFLRQIWRYSDALNHANDNHTQRGLGHDR